jgi:hypothetical protein
MAAKFFTGLPLEGPDPECVHGHGELALAGVGVGDGSVTAAASAVARPRGPDHSAPVRLIVKR